MSLKSRPYYWVECDECESSAQEDSDYTAWSDQGDAIDFATDDGWLMFDKPLANGKQHFCQECQRPYICDGCGESREPDSPCASCAQEATERQGSGDG